MQILTIIHFSNHKNIFLYKPIVCKLTYVCVSRVLTLRTSLYTCIYPHIFIFRIMDTFVQDPRVRKLAYVYALASAHSESLFVCTKTHKYTFFQITAPFVSKPIVCNPTYVYAIASAHSSNLFIYTCIYPQIYRMMHTCIYSQASKCYIMNTFVINRCCANSHMSFPWLVLTLRTFLYTCMCSQEYIHSPRNVDNSIKHICAFMYLFIFIYLSTTCVEHSGLVICGETWSS